MKRFTVADCRATLDRHQGSALVFRDYGFRGERPLSGCLVSIIALDGAGDPLKVAKIANKFDWTGFKTLGYEPAYIDGIEDGFEQFSQNQQLLVAEGDKGDAYRNGLEDGEAIRQAKLRGELQAQRCRC